VTKVERGCKKELESEYSRQLSLSVQDPPYRVFFSEQEGTLDVPDKLDELEAYFESREPDAGAKLREFMQQARYKYQVMFRYLMSVHKLGGVGWDGRLCSSPICFHHRVPGWL
jgi:phytoene desaturase